MVYKKKISLNIKLVTYLLIAFFSFFSTAILAQDEGEDYEDSETNSPCENKWGVDSAETARKLSLFNQYYQEKNYIGSFPYWKYLFENAPCIQKRITFSGPYIIKQVIRDEAYKPRFNGLVDTLSLNPSEKDQLQYILQY